MRLDEYYTYVRKEVANSLIWKTKILNRTLIECLLTDYLKIGSSSLTHHIPAYFTVVSLVSEPLRSENSFLSVSALFSCNFVYEILSCIYRPTIKLYS